MSESVWSLDDIPWDRFDPQAVDPDILKVVKAASLVEYNGNDYAAYLCRVFHDDPAFREAVLQWAKEEVQHGLALGRWAALADPDFDFEGSFERFLAGYRLPQDASESVRGSRSGELVARCIVEVGTSSYYTALGEACREPVLCAICRRIASDEFRHYRLFLTHLRRYLKTENIGRWRRAAVALGRIGETEDDELAYAYYAANAAPGTPYERRRWSRAYGARAYSYYRREHVERVIAMVFKAAGLDPRGTFARLMSRAGYGIVRVRGRRVRTLDKAA